MTGSEVFWWVAGGTVVAVTLATAVVLVVKLVRAKKMLGATGIPMSKKVLFWAAIVYLVSPVDLLPDPILLDDIGFLLFALRSLTQAGAAGADGTGAAAVPPSKRPPETLA
ncbi:YkvA family protein [Kitasatospora sp. NPDC101801]|uniref:YkvA family protein n=1 Tax=Kitasatospora sp. NPDC101801 TaxID=3364103 RepID=UPI003805DD65